MNVRFRNIVEKDWETVSQWWRAAGMKFFLWGDLPENTSFMALVDDMPVLAVSLIVTNCRFAWLEAFVGNPDFTKEDRRKVTKEFLSFLQVVAKAHGAKKLLCMGPCPALTDYYETLGFKKTATVDTLIKEIS